MSIQRIKSGVIADSAVTAAKIDDSTSQLFGFRNRIINGDFRIDQRNAGAAVTINTALNTYTLDRWFGSGQATDGVFTVDQVTDAPAGFTNSTKITVTTADASIGSTQTYLFNHFIEGTNIADLGWGAAGAKTVTVSFWVRSSLTGTFGGSLSNGANNRAYPFTYSISAANTWEYKTVTIAGDTSGTWGTDTGRGIGFRFQIGAGSSASATAGSWTGTSNIFGTTGATNIISTVNADWYITGVQLEVGSVATPFERRPYGMELALCERYYQLLHYFIGTGTTSTRINTSVQFRTEMRATPTLGQTGVFSVTDSHTTQTSQSSISSSFASGRANKYGGQIDMDNFSGITASRPFLNFENAFTLSAEL
jgi:hypothetical protein